MEVPRNLLYTKEHEWLLVEGEEATVGITAYAVEQLGDIVYVELPSVGARFNQMEAFGVVESVKAVADLYCPVSGEVLEINDALEEHPEWVNQEPYGKGWLIRIKILNLDEVKSLLSPEDYEKYIKEETEGSS